MIEDVSFWLDIGLGFRHVWTGPTYPINNNILFFELISLYTTVISEIVCLFSNVYFHSPSFMKNNILRNSSRENFLCIHLSQRDKKRHRVVHKAQILCASSL